MAVDVNGVDWKSAPKDYSVFFEQYYPVIKSMIARRGIDVDNQDDVTSEIITRCLERDIIGAFDADRVFEYDGEVRPARFRSFIGRFIALSVQGHRDKQNRIKTRESQLCDVTMKDDEAGNKVSWIDLYGPPHEDHADDIIDLVADDQEAVHVRELLSKVPPRGPNDRCELPKVYDAVRAQVLAWGHYDIRELQKEFDLGNTTMSQWVWWLKTNLAQIYGRPVPVKRRRTLPTKPS